MGGRKCARPIAPKAVVDDVSGSDQGAKDCEQTTRNEYYMGFGRTQPGGALPPRPTLKYPGGAYVPPDPPLNGFAKESPKEFHGG